MTWRRGMAAGVVVAGIVNCRERGRRRVCEVEGPTGERAICLMFKGRRRGELDSASCFDRYVGEKD